ncbi:MAG: hypothetical protein FJZ01_21310 [Candidatus Sericytochromatia bacterium]|nr:hypothetical protein [Candidatus Tanganyikabacteria bacterium]
MRLVVIIAMAAALAGCAAGPQGRDPVVLPAVSLGYPATRLTLELAPEPAGRAVASIAGIPGNVRITVESSDIQTPVSAVSTASLDSGKLVVEGVPAGKKRLITLTVLGQDGKTPTSVSLRAVADLAVGAQTVAVSPRTTAIGGVFARLLATAPGKVVYPGLDPVAVGALIDQIKSFPPRVPHYALIDTALVADDIADRAGGLPGAGTRYQIAPAAIRLTVAGAPENALARLVVDDPVSPKASGLSRLTTQTGGEYEIQPVLPGTWKLTFQVGNSLSAALPVTVAAGETATASIDFNAQNGWTAGPALPAPLGATGVAVSGTKIYVAGGVTPGGRATDSLYVIDVAAQVPAWTKLPNMKFAREGPAAGVIADVLVVAGGQTVDDAGAKTRVASTEVYSPLLDNWVTGKDLPAAFTAGSAKAIWWGGLASAYSLSKIFAFQGIADYGITLAAAAEYNPYTDTWDATSSPTPLTPRMLSAATLLNNRIYLVGGQKPANPTFNQSAATQAPLGARAEVEVLDVTESPRVWRAAPPLQVGRSEPGAAASPTRVYVAGGVGPGERALASVEAFDPVNGLWFYMPAMRTARSSFGLVYVRNRLWAIGGSPSRYLGFTGGGSALATDSVETLPIGDSL